MNKNFTFNIDLTQIEEAVTASATKTITAKVASIIEERVEILFATPEEAKRFRVSGWCKEGDDVGSLYTKVSSDIDAAIRSADYTKMIEGLVEKAFIKMLDLGAVEKEVVRQIDKRVAMVIKKRTPKQN